MKDVCEIEGSNDRSDEEAKPRATVTAKRVSRTCSDDTAIPFKKRGLFSHLPSVLWMFMLSPTSMLTVLRSMVIKSVSVGTIKRV